MVLAAVAGTEVRTGALLALHWDSSGQARGQPSLFIALTRRGQAASKKLIAPQTSWEGQGRGGGGDKGAAWSKGAGGLGHHPWGALASGPGAVPVCHVG